jgi:hypothetical protein
VEYLHLSEKYQCFVLDKQGQILTRQEFIAGDDDDARSIAQSLSESWTAAATFELWKGIYCLKAALSLFCSCVGLDFWLSFF